ncbi:MAG: CHAT domain-containing protein [Pseudonocardia sp.]
MPADGIDAARAARAELDAVIEEIRALDGFEHFLAPPTFETVATAARTCPLIYFAAADQGGLALVVRGDDVVAVDLDSLTTDALRERVETYQQHYTAHVENPDDDVTAIRWTDELDAVTAWLWDHAVGPVLAELVDDTHAVFVAGGLLGLLPLHAAWTAGPHGGRRYVLDRLAISYSPNSRALTVARDLAARTTPGRLLTVVDPDNAAAPALPYARVEAAGVRAALGIQAGRDLVGRDAMPLAFSREASGSDVLLLACHGRADLAEPLRSGLLLAGRPVTLREIMEMQLRVRLAVLSACETALPGTDLPDEVIGLPTGLLQAGVAGVIASLWAVPDRATAMLVVEFARRWRRDPSDPAEALRATQCWMRDATNRQKVEHWRRARVEAPTVPDHVVDEFVRPLLAAEPDAQDNATPAAWAAFAHLGA